MSDLEYIATICLFICGLLLLPQLFLMRHRIKKMARLRIIQAKAKLHYITRPTDEERNVINNWNWESGRKRDIR